MVAAGAADDFQPYMILPQVKEAKNWWGGHIWEDNVSTKKYIYAFLCYTSETFWHNTSQVEPQEMRSFDDLSTPNGKAGSVFSTRGILVEGKTLGLFSGK